MPGITAPGVGFRVSSLSHRAKVWCRISNTEGEKPLFVHDKSLQCHAKPDRPDPVYAKKLQEILGAQFGEITVMMQYLFQGWNCRGPAKYKALVLDIGTEEIS